MEAIKNIISDYQLTIPDIIYTDVIEIIILAFLIYHVVKWIKNTRAWTLVKGLAVIMLFWFIGIIFQLNVVIWIISNTIDVGIIAILIVFQPELRKALEQLGKKNIVRSILVFDDNKEERFSDYTLNEIIRATFELARNMTGALMVIEERIPLNEFEGSGIPIDSILSSQLLINIFERNTPLHDGAVIIRGNRIVSATVYLPSSENIQLSKELGTRHRAGISISEMTDCLTIIVSEETGKVSLAREGKLIRNIDGDYLRAKLIETQKKTVDTRQRLKFWKGRLKNERKVD